MQSVNYKLLWSVLLIGGIAFNVNAVTGRSGIEWEDLALTQTIEDIRTEGKLCWAYTCANADVTLNGVTFKTTSKCWVPSVTESEWSDMNTDLAGIYRDASVAPSALSEDYKALLHGFMYCDGEDTRTLDLRHLVIGHRYMIQLWIHDGRPSPGYVRDVLVDNAVTVPYLENNRGHYLVGYFTATKARLAIYLEPHAFSPLIASQASAQWNAVQLRDLTPDLIDWQDPVSTTGDDQVNNMGQLLYAFFSKQSKGDFITVNNVDFKRVESEGYNINNCFAGCVDFACNSPYILKSVHFQGDGTFFSREGYEDTISENMVNLLDGGCYHDDSSNIDAQVTITLHRLTAGAKYAVQLWTADKRGGIGTYRQLCVDASKHLTMSPSDRPYQGQNITGIFTAHGSTQTFTLQGLVPTKKLAYPTIQINAIQVRQLEGPMIDRTGNVVWQRSQECRGIDEILSLGSVHLASFATTSDPLTFKGTTFTTSLAGQSNVSFANMSMGNGSAFMPSSTPYTTMLRGAIFQDGYTTGTVTLKNLVIGHRYNVQLWVADYRTDVGLKRYMMIDGYQKLPYYSSNYILGTFTAVGNTQTFDLVPFGIGDFLPSPQVNALLVRDIGDVDTSKIAVWTGESQGEWKQDSTNWQQPNGDSLQGNLWSPADSSTTETEAYTAYLPASTTLDPVEPIRVRAIECHDEIVIGHSGGNIPVTITEEIDAASCTFYAPWASADLFKSRPGDLVVAGDVSALKRVSVTAGTVRIDTPPATGLQAWLETPGRLQLGDESVLLNYLSGDGSLVGNHDFILDNAAPCTFAGSFDEGASLTKIGKGCFTYAGNHPKDFPIALKKGCLRLTGTSTNALVITSEANTMIDLASSKQTISTLLGNTFVTNGVLLGVVTVEGPTTLAAVTLDTNAQLNCKPKCPITLTGNQDLSTWQLYVANPESFDNKTPFLVCTGDTTGEPVVTLSKKSSLVEKRELDEGTAYYLKMQGYCIIIR